MMLVATTLAAFSPIFNYVVDGKLEHSMNGAPGRAVRGRYWFRAPDGSEHETKYVADSQGYRLVY